MAGIFQRRLRYLAAGLRRSGFPILPLSPFSSPLLPFSPLSPLNSSFLLFSIFSHFLPFFSPPFSLFLFSTIFLQFSFTFFHFLLFHFFPTFFYQKNFFPSLSHRFLVEATRLCVTSLSALCPTRHLHAQETETNAACCERECSLFLGIFRHNQRKGPNQANSYKKDGFIFHLSRTLVFSQEKVTIYK